MTGTRVKREAHPLLVTPDSVIINQSDTELYRDVSRIHIELYMPLL